MGEITCQEIYRDLITTNLLIRYNIYCHFIKKSNKAKKCYIDVMNIIKEC